MRRYFYLIVFCLSTFISVAQHLEKTAAKPPYNYIYAINKEQAWKINAYKYRSVYTKEFLSKPLDSIGVADVIPAKYHKGGYILLSALHNQFHTTFITSNNFFVHNIRTPTEVGIAVRNIQNENVLGVQFYTETTQIELKHNGHYYVVPKELHGTNLLVAYSDEFFLVDIPTVKKKYKYESEFDGRAGSKGFVLTDKPKYHIGDTVFMKGYFKPTLLPKKTHIQIEYKNNKYREVVVFKQKIRKDENGSYTSNVVLSDTLPIDLKYSISLSRKHDYAFNKFTIEDYHLDDFLLEAMVRTGGRYQDSITIKINCTTPQGDPINSGWIYFTIKPRSIDLADVKDAYVPYVILKDSVEATGQKTIVYKGKMPELPYGDYGMDLTLQVSNNGLIEEVERSFQYTYKPFIMTHSITGHVCEFKPYGIQEVPSTGFALYENSRVYDTIPITFPYRVDFQNQKLPTAFIVNQSMIQVQKNTILNKDFQFNYFIQQDKIVLEINNPFQLSIQIKDKEGKELYHKDESFITIPIAIEKEQLLYLEYSMFGEFCQKDLTISPDYKSLMISASIADTIAPGARIETQVHVSDVHQKALRNVNLTALAVDTRLEHSGVPNSNELIQYDYDNLVGDDMDYVYVQFIKDTALVKEIYQDYNRFLYTDSINYFLIQETNTAQTEAFIYINENDRYIRPGYVFEDGKPVYWTDVDKKSTQSFYTSPGYHSYEIRLPNKTIFIDSVFVFESFKNNILIPIDRIPSNRFRSIARPRHLTADERAELSKYLYTVKSPNRFSLETRTNYYTDVPRLSHLINSDSTFHFISDKDTIVIRKRANEIDKSQKDYLKRQRFRSSKAIDVTITMSELKTLEVLEYTLKTNPYKAGVNSVYVSPSNQYATVYLSEYFLGTTILKLIDTSRVELIDTSEYSRGFKFNLEAGTYRVQAFDLTGVLLKEQSFDVTDLGYYLMRVFPDSIRIKVVDERYTNIYSLSEASYPYSTMYYETEYSRSRSRSRRRSVRYNYWGVFTGLNGMYTSSPKISWGYEVGALLGHQFSKHLRAELRFAYGKTAVEMSQPYYHSFGKIGAMAWYSIFNYERNDFNVMLGTGISGQQIIDTSIKNTGMSIPVGVSLKYKLPYTQSIHLELFWNKTISGTDYSYMNKGMWEINLRFNFSLPRRRGRVLCPSNFWGSESDVARAPRYRYEETYVSTVDNMNAVAAKTGLVSDSIHTFDAPNYSSTTVELVRSNFYDRAYWIPSFKTDKNGNASFNASYPDALTHWDNYIVAYKGRQSNTWYFKNTSYLTNYVQVYAPRFVIRGDSASVRYHVQSDKPFSIRNSVNEIVFGESTSTDGGYAFTVSNANDSVFCKSILLVDNKQLDGEVRAIPVYDAGNATYTGSYAYVTGDTTVYVHKPDSALETKLYVSNNMQDFVRMQYTQLMDYTYSCNEQTASKLIGSIYGKQLYGTFEGNHPHNYFSKLKKNLNDDGMFGWWGNAPTNTSMSAYVFYAFKLYYKSINKDPDRFYLNLGAKILEHAKNNKVTYFTYWLMKEAELPVDKKSLQVSSQEIYQEKILALRIRQLEGETIKRNEIEKQLNQTILNNLSLKSSPQLSLNWYEDELIYLMLLHKIAAVDFPDIAARIQRGLVEHGCLSEYAPTYVKALFIHEFASIAAVQKNNMVVSFDNKEVTQSPFIKAIQDTAQHVLIVKNALGGYIVKSDKQIRTTATVQSGLEIDYTFNVDGKPVSILKSGTMVDQVVSLKLSQSCSYIMVEIPIAAGCMVEDVMISYPGLLSHREVFRDKIILYFDRIPAGTYTFTIREKVLFNGNYQLNPCSVNLMYFPMIQTQTALRRIVIE